MVYKNFNIALFTRVFFLISFTVGATFLFISAEWTLFALCMLFLTLTIYNIIDYFNSVNRKLAFLFDSIRNEDSTLHFPERVRAKTTKKLHQSLNHLNEVISKIKIRNEHKERFFLEFMRHSTTGLMAVDEKGYVEIVNDAALKLFNTGILVHLKRLKQVNKELYEVIKSLKPNQSKTLKLSVKDELHIVLIKMVKLKFGEMNFNIYSLSDIKTELEEKEMETWQKLIRILTHEIMNSIAPISSISDTMMKYFHNGKKLSVKEMDNIEHGLDVINDRSKGLIHFVDSYRTLTKIPKPVFKLIDVNTWLDSILLLFQDRAENDQIEIEVKNEYKRETFLGDQKLLTQVVLNLLNNAADAIREVENKKIIIHITTTESGNISLKFIDNGPGISPENLDQVFIPFFTTKENGSGIGLSLSRQIVNLHKGQLLVHSQPGKETVFEMRV